MSPMNRILIRYPRQGDPTATAILGRSLFRFCPGANPCRRSLSLSSFFPLAGVLDGPGLADDRDLDLARILHLVLDTLGDVPGHDVGGLIIDLLALDHHPDLPARLDGEALLHPLEGDGDLLQLRQALDVGLQ